MIFGRCTPGARILAWKKVVEATVETTQLETMAQLEVVVVRFGVVVVWLEVVEGEEVTEQLVVFGSAGSWTESWNKREDFCTNPEVLPNQLTNNLLDFCNFVLNNF